MELDLLDHSSPAISERESLVQLQQRMEQETHLHIIPPVEHAFILGIYSREILIPEGTLVAGRIHKGEHLSVISLGIVQVVEENLLTKEIHKKTYMAPCRFHSPAGTKRMVYAISDTVWTTFHKYEGSPDPDGIEDVFTCPDRETWATQFLKGESS
ncbi:MAG: hypothetical protein Q7S87_04665 [Agitococcus sp.]|nr:hypothetical protein [Agitococcus sp.]